MFDLAKAMALANKAKRKLKRNPEEFFKGMPPLTFEIVGYYNRPTETKVLNFLGEGAWTVAFVDDDENVFLFVDEDSPWADNSKAFLAHFNSVHGDLTHIPKIESYGSFDNSNEVFEQMDYGDIEVYISPLYEVPVNPNKKSHAKAYIMYEWLKKAIDRAKGIFGTLDDEGNVNTTQIRDYVWRKAESAKHNAPQGITEDEWEEFIENLILLISESIDFSDTLNMEIRRENAGVDENGDLILLDIFYDQVGMDNI